MTNAIIFAYLLAMILIGVLYRKRAGTGDAGFLVADRSVSAWLGGGALASTFTSTSSFLGVIGLISTFGAAVSAWGNVAILVGFALALLFVAPQIRRYGITSFPEFFAIRFDRRVSALAAVVTFLAMFVYMIAQIQGGAFAAQYVLGVNYEVAVLVIGFVFITYVVFGGSFAAIVTSFWQNLMMLAAMGSVGFTVLVLQDWNDVVSDNGAGRSVATDVWGSSAMDAVGFALLLGMGAIAAPHVVIRYAAAKDEKVAARTTWYSMLYISVFYLAAMVVGLYAARRFAGAKNPDMTFFPLVDDLFPSVVLGLFVATVLAAAMSTTDAQLLVAASALTNDLYPVIFKREISKERAVMITRWVVVIVGLLTILATLRPPGLIILVMALAQSLMVGGFLAPLLLGLWWKGATSLGALAGMAGGCAAAILLSPQVGLDLLPSAFFSGPVAAVVSLLLVVTVSVGQRRSDPPEEIGRRATSAAHGA